MALLIESSHELEFLSSLHDMDGSHRQKIGRADLLRSRMHGEVFEITSAISVHTRSLWTSWIALMYVAAIHICG
jgi:hypothetical protein